MPNTANARRILMLVRRCGMRANACSGHASIGRREGQLPGAARGVFLVKVEIIAMPLQAHRAADAIAQFARGNTDVDTVRLQARVLRHEGKGADLAPVADLDIDVDCAAESDGDIRTN